MSTFATAEMSSLSVKRFWAKVIPEPNSGCWLWAGATNTRYGVFHIRTANALAHRISYELSIGPIPDGLQIDHLCRTRLCVRPAHLEAVTLVENVMRGEGLMARQARATHCHRGHLFDEANTQLRIGRGGRVQRNCRLCNQTMRRVRDRRAREERNG